MFNRGSDINISQFVTELFQLQISAREFFSANLLEFLNTYFNVAKPALFFFDRHGTFLSLLTDRGFEYAGADNPYSSYAALDMVRNTIYRDAVRDRLTFFNMEPRLYLSTDIIDASHYDASSYVLFLENQFQMHYSASLVFGINGYVQLTFFKSLEEGPFNDEEIEMLRSIYGYLAGAYQTFQKYKQALIVSEVQEQIIASNECAYLIADELSYVLSYNKYAEDIIEGLWGSAAVEQLSSSSPCSWLSFVFDGAQRDQAQQDVLIHSIKGCTFKIHQYERTCSCGIVDVYYWMTITSSTGKASNREAISSSKELSLLTRAEREVAHLICEGLTYQEIADELFVSFHTVKKHVQSIYRKCGVSSRNQLYRLFKG